MGHQAAWFAQFELFAIKKKVFLLHTQILRCIAIKILQEQAESEFCL